ncbi:MAG: NUDIX domain-containing protein [Chloroflexi bacterium]|nr:NUDIX domain-containing protein [Chloroflexota bacterium]
MERLWTPWRHSYVTGDQRAGGTVFESLAADTDDETNLVLLRGRLCYVLMNLFPYNTGHLMIIPYRRVAEPADLTADEWAEVGDLLRRVTLALRATLRPDGFNIGLNIGAAAGAGLPDHLHLHVVPRWTGDTNFMPVLGATKVLPELVPDTYARLRHALQGDVGELAAAAPVLAPAAAATSDEPTTVAADDDSESTSPVTVADGEDTPADDRAVTDRAVPAATIDRYAVAASSALPATASEPAAVFDAATVDGSPGTDAPGAVAAVVMPAAEALSIDEPAAVTAGSVIGDVAATAALPVDATEAGQPTEPETITPESAPSALAPVYQAGAVVLVRDKVALRLAKDQTWVLPKGHIEVGESAEQAAVREVAEEMGLSGALGPFIDELRFTFRNQERIVRYYLLRADGHLPTWNRHFGRDTFLFSQREALTRLTHDDARAVLARALELTQAR